MTEAEKDARNLAAATQDREREGHLDVPRRHKETLRLADGSTVEIGLDHQEPLRSEQNQNGHPAEHRPTARSCRGVPGHRVGSRVGTAVRQCGTDPSVQGKRAAAAEVVRG